MTRSALFVLGMHAGGASALAGALARAGAATGATATPTVDEGTGATSCAPLVTLSETALSALGVSWDSLAAPPERWPDSPAIRALAPAAQELVAREFGAGTSAVIAEPRVCRLFPLWRAAFEACGFSVSAILLVRRPHEVAAALAKRLQFAPEKSLALWLSHLGDAERGTRGVRRTLITHDALADDPAAALTRIAGDAAFPLAATKAALEAATALTKANRSHTAAARRGGGLGSGLDAVLEEGYEKLARLAPGADPRRDIEALVAAARPALNAAIPPWLLTELDAARLATQKLAADLAQARQRTDESARELAALRANPAPDPQALAAQFDALRADQAREREALLKQLEGTRGELSRLSAAFAEAPRAEAALRAELAQTHRDLFDERASIMRLAEEIETTRRDAEGNAHRFESARYHLEALATELAQARNAVQARENEYAFVADEVDGLRIRLDDLQSERDALRKERDDATRQLAIATTDRDAARREHGTAVTERDALSRIVHETSDALAALREELPRRAAAEAALTAERDRIADELRLTAQRAAALDVELAERGAYIAELTDRHNGLAARLADLDQRTMVRAAVWMTGKPRARHQN